MQYSLDENYSNEFASQNECIINKTGNYWFEYKK